MDINENARPAATGQAIEHTSQQKPDNNSTKSYCFVPPNWFNDTLAAIPDEWRVTPRYRNGKCGPYAEGQTHRSPLEYRAAVAIGLVQDDCVLLDYDGNKAKEKGESIESVANLAKALGVDLSAPFQWNAAKDSLHFLFRLPKGVDRAALSASITDWRPFIDIKTKNQPVFLKPHKSLRDGRVPAKTELPECPKIIIDALKARNYKEKNIKKASEPFPAWDGNRAEVEQAREYLSFILAKDYDHWLQMMMGVVDKFGKTETSFELIDGWSASEGNAWNYSGAEVIRYKIRSFKKEGYTFASVVHYAVLGGADKSRINRMFDPDGTRRRDYGELVEVISGFDKDTAPADVKAVAIEFQALDKLEHERLFKLIKDKTGDSLEVLRKMVSSNFNGEGIDHHYLAMRFIGSVGAKNLVGLDNEVRQWLPKKGYWGVLPGRLLKKQIQDFVRPHVETITSYRIVSIAELVKTEIYRVESPFVPAKSDSVNCLNGELFVEPLKVTLKPHVREHYLTTQIPVAYDPDAQAPRFEQYLNEIFEGDQDADQKRQAILEMMAYSLVSHCKFERFVLLLGEGANGKSVLLEVIKQLCGRQNVASVQPSQFDNKFQRSHLEHKLVNIISETKEGAVIDEASLKSITSGESTTVESKNKDPRELRPYSTCWFGSNHRPHTRDFSQALFRRALVVPFNRVFSFAPGSIPPDPDLSKKLRAELPGILKLAVNAYSDALMAGKLTTPISCIQSRDDWAMEANQVAQYVEECCKEVAGSTETLSELYTSYDYWARESGISRRLAKKSFGQRLTRLGFEESRIASGMIFHGLKITEKSDF